MSTIASTEPGAVTAGDTVRWRRELPGFSAADGWALQYVLISAAHKYTLSATADGVGHLVNAAPGVTGTWVPGSYAWAAVVTKAGERYTVGNGALVVKPDLASSSITSMDTRTSARKALDSVNQALESFGNKAWMQSYAIGGRQQSFRSLEEFMSFRSKLVAEVAREDAAAGRRPSGGRKLQIRFNTR